ncbi:MAG: WecB/TagA/CpsF family glycosyltransferase [Ktedonobacterales bacterium]
MSIRVSFLGLGIDEMAPAEAVETIRGLWRSRLKSRIFFVNAHCFNMATADEQYRNSLDAADLVLADGSGMLLASRLLRVPIQHNLNGTDLVPLLCGAAAEEGRSVFLLGARPGVAERAAARLQEGYPGLRIAGIQHGYFASEESEAIISRINAAKPDMLLVAMGVPLQEQWITDHFTALDVPVSLAVGALLDFFSNTVPRAPRLFRRLGIEWLYRLYREPRRLWRRYMVGNVTFLSRVLLALVTSKAMLPAPQTLHIASVDGGASITGIVELPQLASMAPEQEEEVAMAGVLARASGTR